MITQTHERLFQRAYNLAHFGEHRVRVGALAANKSTTICGAFNTIRNHTLNDSTFLSYTRHAEWNCLRMVPYNLLGNITLYVARIDPKSNLKPSYPCNRCLPFIQKLGIKEIIYWNHQLILQKI